MSLSPSSTSSSDKGRFLRRLAGYLSLAALFWLVHLCSMVLLTLAKPRHYTLHHSGKPISGKKVFIMGNSHTECAVNDAMMGGRYLNVSQSAEPILYTTVKAQNIIDMGMADTLVIGYDKVVMQSIGSEVQEERLYAMYREYFSQMDMDQHRFLMRHDPWQWMKSLLFLNYWDVSSYSKIRGRYRRLERNRLEPQDSSIQAQRAELQRADGRHASIERWNTHSIQNLIRRNPQVYFILVRMPVHRSYVSPNEKEYMSAVDGFRGFGNLCFVDFARSIDLPDSCYGDLNHLNHTGAALFTPFFKKVLEL